MNRKQRRKDKIQVKNISNQMSRQDLKIIVDKMISERMQEIRHATMKNTINIMYYHLNKKFRYGKGRLKQLEESFKENKTDIIKGGINSKILEKLEKIGIR